MVRKIKNPNYAPQNQVNIIKQAKQMQEQMLKVQDGLKDKEVSLESAGGQIKVRANGQKKILSLEIGKDILNDAQQDPSELELLILNAINDVYAKAEALAEEEMEAITGGVSIPGLF